MATVPCATFLILLVCLSLGLPTSVSSQNFPFPQHATYSSGSILPSGSRDSLDNDVKTFYDYWKAKYVVTETVGGQFRARVRDNANNRTVSEGQGYGMVIMALMAGYDSQAQTLFDGMYRYAKAYPVPPENRLMIWQIQWNGTTDQDDSAFDGDADIAYALILAHRQWGSTGDINYAQAASDWLDGIASQTIGSTTHLPLLGSWVPSDEYSEKTPRSSDFMYDHFRVWSKFQSANETFWMNVLLACQNVVNTLQGNEGSATGLLPDFIVYDNGLNRYKPAPGNFLEDPNDGAYYYNAGRDPWRIALDALLYDDATSRNQTEKMSNWIQNKANGSASNIQAGYALSGNTLGGSNYFTTFFVAPFGVAAMLQPSQQAWLDSIYGAVKNAHENYYEDTVTLLCMLVMSGNWWDPMPAGADGGADGSDGGADGGSAAQLQSWRDMM